MPKTAYPQGLHLFVDTPALDTQCTPVVTGISEHLFNTFQTVRTSNLLSVYGKVITKNGAEPQPALLPDRTDLNQRDADVVAVPGTDDVVAVWSSNAATGVYQVYIKRYRVNANGTFAPLSPTTLVSQSNGDYVAPRVTYNVISKLFFVIWSSVKDKQIQYAYFKYRDDVNQFEYNSYEAHLNEVVSPGYFSNSLVLATQPGRNTSSLFISLINIEGKVVAALRRDANRVLLVEFSAPAGGNVPVAILPDFEATNILHAHTSYDQVSGDIKIVYSTSKDNYIYGANITHFSFNKQARAAPVRLNQSNNVCYRPYIKETPFIPDSFGGMQKHYVAWETTNSSVHYNAFDHDFIPLSAEITINAAYTTTEPAIAISENQVVVLAQTLQMSGGPALSRGGIIMYVESYIP